MVITLIVQNFNLNFFKFITLQDKTMKLSIGLTFAVAFVYHTSPTACGQTTAVDVYQKNTEGQTATQLMSMDINSNWQNCFIAAPSSIALMGSLVVISGKRNFQFRRLSNNANFRYIRYPNFRTTMLQVSNEGWNAFQAAHTNMEGVRIQARSLPRLVKRVSALLVEGTPAQIVKFVPMYLKAMKASAQKCATLTKDTNTKFNDVMLLLMEIDVALSDTSSHNKKELNELEREIARSEKEKKMLEDAEKRAKERFEDITKQLEEDRKQYLQAVRDIPSGFKATLAALFRTIGDLFNGRAFNKNHDGRSKDSYTEVEFNQANENYIENVMILSKTEDYVMVMNKFLSLLNKIINQQGGPTMSLFDDLSSLDIAMKVLNNRTSNEADSTYKRPLLEIVGKTLDYIKQFKEKISQTNSISKTGVINLKSDLGEVVETAKELIKTGKQQSGMANNELKPVSQQSFSGNEEYIANQRLEVLEANEQRYEAQYQQLLKFNAKLGRLLEKLASMDLSQANITKIQALIRDAIELMSKLKTVWSTVIEMFDRLSATIDIAMNPSIEVFRKYASTTTEMISTDPTAKQQMFLIKDVIQSKAGHISTQATFVKTFAEVYVNISSEYLVGPLTEMAALQLLETETERVEKLASLNLKSKQAQTQIVALAAKKRIEFEQNVAIQKQNIDDIFSAVEDDNSER